MSSISHKELAKLCWESYWEGEDFGTFSCYWHLEENTVICAFTGSNDRVDWIYNARILQVPSEIPHFKGGVHCGFMDLSIDVARCLKMVMEGRYKARRLILTGHSLGGALAIVAALRLREFDPSVVTFGAPKVFNKEGVRNYKMPATHYINGDDCVPHIPHLSYSYNKNIIWLNKPNRVISFIRENVPSVTNLAVGIPSHSIERYYNEL